MSTQLTRRLEFLRGYLVAYALIEYTAVIFMVLGYTVLPEKLFIIPIIILATAGTLALLSAKLLKHGRFRLARITTLISGLLGVGFPSTIPAIYLIYRTIRKKHWITR